MQLFLVLLLAVVGVRCQAPAVTNFAGTAATSVTVTLPSHEEGDFLLVLVAIRPDSRFINGNTALPPGYTEIPLSGGSPTTGTGSPVFSDLRVQAFYKTAGPAEGDPTFSFSNTNNPAQNDAVFTAIAYAFENVITGAPQGLAFDASSSDTLQTFAPPSLSVTLGNYIAIGVAAVRVEDSSTPATVSPQFDNPAGFPTGYNRFAQTVCDMTDGRDCPVIATATSFLAGVTDVFPPPFQKGLPEEQGYAVTLAIPAMPIFPTE